MSKLRLLEYCPGPSDATSYYRGRLPLSYLSHRYDEEIEHIILPSLDNVQWPDIINSDIVFLQRPTNLAEFGFMRAVKDCGRKIIIDYDDYLFDIPIYNSTYDYFMNPETHDTMTRILAVADEIWVSTKNLMDSLVNRTPEIKEKIFVIENGHNDIDFPTIARRPHVANDIVLWRGGPSHNGDLLYYKDQLLEVINTHPELKFYFFGKIPKFLNDGFIEENVFSMKDYLSIFPYHRAVHNLNPMMNLIILEPNEFNAAKSDINQIEGSYAGAFNFDKPRETFVKEFNYYLENKEEIKKWANFNWKHIKETMLLSDRITDRYERIKELNN